MNERGPGIRPSATPTTSPPPSCCGANASECSDQQRTKTSSNGVWPTTTPRSASTSMAGGVMATRTSTPKTARDLTGEIAYLTRALKAPTLRDSVERLAERAVAESWSHLEFLVACLQREVSA